MNEPIFTVCDRCDQIHDAQGDVYACVEALKRELRLTREYLADAKGIVADQGRYIGYLEDGAPRTRKVSSVEVGKERL